MKQKIKRIIQAMYLSPKMFASNKESFVTQIYLMLYLLDKITTHEEKVDFFKRAELIENSSFVHCSDEFNDEWAKKIAKYALDLLE